MWNNSVCVCVCVCECVCAYVYMCKEGQFHLFIFLFLSVSAAFQLASFSLSLSFLSLNPSVQKIACLVFKYLMIFYFLQFCSLNLLPPQELRLKYKAFSSHIQEVFLLPFPSVCPYVYWFLIDCAVETAVYYLCVCEIS